MNGAHWRYPKIPSVTAASTHRGLWSTPGGTLSPLACRQLATRTPPYRPDFSHTTTVHSPSMLLLHMTPPAGLCGTPSPTVVANQAGPATTPPGNFPQTSVRIAVSNAASNIDHIAEFYQNDPQIIHLQCIFKVLGDLLQNTEPGVPLPIRIEYQSSSSSSPNSSIATAPDTPQASTPQNPAFPPIL